MLPFFDKIIGPHGVRVLESLEKTCGDLSGYITPRVIVGWLRQTEYGNVSLPQGCGLIKLEKTGYGYNGKCNIQGQDHEFKYAPEEYVAATITTACNQSLNKSSTKDLDLARLAKTIDMLVKATKLQYERTQHVQSLEPEGFIPPDMAPAKQIAKPTIPKVAKPPLKKIAVLTQPVLETAETNESGVHFKTGKAVQFRYVHSPQKLPYYGKRFGQDIEPSGKYITNAAHYSELSPDWETGITEFKNPLVIKLRSTDHDEIYGDRGWKSRLSQHFGEKGLKLSHAVLKAGYDGIVTVHPDGKNTSEIVDLRPAAQWSKPKRKKLTIWKTETSRPCSLCDQPLFSNDKFVGCTCFKPLAKNIVSTDDKLTITLEFDDGIDQDAMLALIGALKHGR